MVVQVFDLLQVTTLLKFVVFILFLSLMALRLSIYFKFVFFVSHREQANRRTVADIFKAPIASMIWILKCRTLHFETIFIICVGVHAFNRRIIFSLFSFSFSTDLNFFFCSFFFISRSIFIGFLFEKLLLIYFINLPFFTFFSFHFLFKLLFFFSLSKFLWFILYSFFAVSFYFSDCFLTRHFLFLSLFFATFSISFFIAGRCLFLSYLDPLDYIFASLFFYILH